MTRDSAGAGERASAAWLAERLEEAGAADVRVEPYRFQGTYGVAHALHALAGLVAPLPALVSLELEASGRLQWIRRLLPAGEGANVVARVPARGARRRTLVLVAHHDAARTGLVWHPRVVALGAARNLRRRRIDGYEQPLALGLLLAALPWRPARRAGRALLALAIALQADVARSPTVPGANDNATGVAALLALADDPPPGARLIVAAVGCEESGMGGMRAFLREHDLDPATTLVLSLDTLGCGTPIVLSGEGTIREHRYDPALLDLVDCAADRAGLERPPRWRIGGWTDPILARFRGLPAISLLSMGPGHFTHYHHPSDVPENVDFDCVERCLALARAVAEEWVSRP